MSIVTEYPSLAYTNAQHMVNRVLNRIDQLTIVERHVSRGASLVPSADGQRYVVTYPDGRSVAVVSRRYIPCML
jgi:hypothetical protein